MTASPSERPASYLKIESLARELEISERTIHEMVKRGVLPRPVRLSAGCVRWDWNQVRLALDALSGSGATADEDPFLVGLGNASAPRQ